MPYVITTTTPDPANVKAHAPDAPAPSPMGAVRGCWPPAVTRRAVATLDDARETVERAVTSVPGYTSVIGFPTQAAVADAISEAGGMIGPLPDGTVIEVERVSGYALAQRTIAKGRVIGLDPRSPNAEKQRLILNAYNAAQA